MPEIGDDVKTAVQTALSQAAKESSGANPLAPQALLGLPTPHLDLGGAKDKVVTAIDDVTKALDLVLKFSWLIPAQYEVPLQNLRDALVKVKGWIG